MGRIWRKACRILAKSLIQLAEEKGVSKEAVQEILKEETKAVYLATGKHWRFRGIAKGQRRC